MVYRVSPFDAVDDAQIGTVVTGHIYASHLQAVVGGSRGAERGGRKQGAQENGYQAHGCADAQEATVASLWGRTRNRV